MAKVLVIRMSSLGDVAMLVPVVMSVAAKYPQSRFTVLTRTAFAPLFKDLAFNINTISVDPSKKHKGFIGLLLIINKVMFRGFTHVADEHDVLRSKFIRFFMKLTGSKVRHIDKGKQDKAEMILSKKVYPPLKATTERYLDTFSRLGLPAKMVFSDFFDFKQRDLSIFKDKLPAKQKAWIGIAPFAKHKGKTYPPEKMENIIKELVQDGNTIFLLGGKGENDIFERWQRKQPDLIINMAGKLNLEKELLLISYMDVVVSMDSANMHLASLVNVPVVSIWGATHPSLGFYGFNQDPNNAVQIGLNCRPCSVFGDKPCERGDYACLQQLPEEAVLDKINEILSKKTIQTTSEPKTLSKI